MNINAHSINIPLFSRSFLFVGSIMGKDVDGWKFIDLPEIQPVVKSIQMVLSRAYFRKCNTWFFIQKENNKMQSSEQREWHQICRKRYLLRVEREKRRDSKVEARTRGRERKEPNGEPRPFKRDGAASKVSDDLASSLISAKDTIVSHSRFTSGAKCIVPVY